MTIFNRTNPPTLNKSHRLHDVCLGEIVLPTTIDSLDAESPGHVILGYPDDEGILLNHGKVGSAQAPVAIRNALYRMALHIRETSPPLYDLGDLSIKGDITDRHARARAVIKEILLKNHRFISLGGGNDYAYPDGAGFLETQKKRPLVINIDAHFDLRPAVNGPTSGTPFFQLLEEFDNFDLVEVGIQPFANSEYFFTYAKEHNVKTFTFEQSHGRLDKVFRSISSSRRPTYLSIDIDAFSSVYAPGASASYPIGLNPFEFLKALPILINTLDLKGIGIYEVSPPLDRGEQTSQLVAIILHTYLSLLKK